MNKPCSNSKLLACGLATLTLALSASAHPYASGITNAGGIIKFFLNESNVTSIKVAFDNNTVTNDLAALGQTNVGVNSFSLGIHTNFSIIVTKLGSGVASQISPTPATGAASTNLAFFGGRGVAVNKNPKSSHFGRIYVANANAGVQNGRQVYKGLYAINPDYTDALGQGTNSLPLRANFPSAGTQWWGGSTTYGPYRLWVGSDNTVYAADSSGSGSTAGDPVWMIDPYLTTPIAMFTYSGVTGGNSGNAGPCQSQPHVSGSLATGDLTLTCMMWNYNAAGGGYQSVLRYNIGSGPINSSQVWTANPTIVATNTQPGFGNLPGINGVTVDSVVGPNGYVYVTYPRSGTGGSIAGGNNNLWVYDNQVPANLLWASADPNTGGVSVGGNPATNDCFVAQSITMNGIAISSDTNYLVSGNGLAANFVVVRLTNGIPDKSTITKYTAPNAINRSVAFDAANNVYTVEGNSSSLRAYSLGLTTTAYTYNDITGTNGTFQLVLPPTTVSVAAVNNQASQTGPTPGLFTLTRSGQDLNLPLTVNFTLSGTASNTVYTLSPAGLIPATNNTITFAANQTTTNITVIPTFGDGIPRPTTTVILTLAGASGYAVGSPANATIFIQNTVTPGISVTTQDAQMYERTNDYARVRITRLGNTNVDLTAAINLSFGGTAQANTDWYTDVTTVDLPAGINTTNIKVFPIHNGVVTGPLTITATAASGTGYNPLATTGTVTIVDSDLPAETVLWRDDFDTFDSSTNWIVFFASTNGAPEDYTLTFGYNYSFLAIPPAPHSALGDTFGAYMTVNKSDGAPVAAALNLYPTNQSFSGNYALRFDMYLTRNDTSGQTEYAIFGINHSATKTNWFRNSTTSHNGVDATSWDFDGIFFDIEADGAALGDYAIYSSPTTVNRNPTPLNNGRNASTLEGIFKAPPWTATAGSGGTAANVYGSTTPIWADVEISQVDGIITWKINQTVIFAYTNTTIYTLGDIMIGYCDAYDSTGVSGGSVVYDNVRVVSLPTTASVVITSIQTDATTAKITFSAGASDTAAQFELQSAASANGTYSDVGSTKNTLGGGSFRFDVPLNGSAQFYRIRRIP